MAARDDGVVATLLAQVLGEEPSLTREDVQGRTGVDRELTSALWRALGFAATDDGDVAFTPADVAALGRARALVDDGVLVLDELLQAARLLGRSMSTLASAQADLVGQVLGRLGSAGSGQPSPTGALPSGRAVADLLGDVESLLRYAWRRHLAAELAGTVDLTGVSGVGRTRTTAVGFVDVVGYTELTRDAPIEDVVAVLRLLEEDAVDLVAAAGGRVVKTLGDGVLFTVDDLGAAAGVALGLVTRSADAPSLRGGLAYGPVLLRGGDVLGAVVNLAARVCAVARPGTVLVDREAAGLLGQDPRYTVAKVPRVRVRGYEHLAPWVLRSAH